MDTLSDDLLQNLSELTKHISTYKSSVLTSNIDLEGTSDIFPKCLVAPPRIGYNSVSQPVQTSGFGGMSISSNVPGLEQRLLGASASMALETKRVLALDQDVDHSAFKVDVKELSSIETLISEYTVIISDLKKKKTELRQKTLKHMVSHKMDVANISKKESFSVVTTKKKINPTTKVRLPHKIRDYFIKEEKMGDKEAEELSAKIVKWVHANAEYQLAKVLRHKKAK
jgi:hypothetical protein